MKNIWPHSCKWKCNLKLNWGLIFGLASKLKDLKISKNLVLCLLKEIINDNYEERM